MSHQSIESWRATHAPQHQKTLPNLLSKLKIIPRPESKVTDDSALDTWSESSIEGLPPASHTLPSEPYHTRERSLSKSNPMAPGRRASVISMSPDQTNSPGGLSRLTIVRAPSGSKENKRSATSSPAMSMPHSPLKSLHPPPPSVSGPSSPRLSFASSSFGSPIGSHIASGFQSGSYMSLPDDPSRPSHSRQGSLGGRENALELTPREVVDMARSTSSGHARSFSSSSASSFGPSGRALSSSRQWDRHQAEEEEFEPVEFVPLEDEVLLPFETRGAEIKDLMDEGKNKALFHLLKLAFPSTEANVQASEADPKTWSFPTLVTYLTQVERQSMPDRIWVNKVQQAVEYRSEPLWEKLKGLLGVDDGDFDSVSAGAHPIDNGRPDRIEKDVWIQGLEYADDSDDQLDSLDRSPHSRSRRRSSKFDSLEDGIIGGASFSPDRDSISLPSTASYESSVSSHIMEPIGEDEEEGSPPVESPSTTTPKSDSLVGKLPGSSPLKQSSLNVSEGHKTPMGGTPERAFSLDRSDTIKPDRKNSATGSGDQDGNDGREPSPTTGSTRPRTRSYVGVSIVSSPIQTGLSGGPGDTGGCSSFTNPSDLSGGPHRGRSSFSSSSFSSSSLARDFARPSAGTSADATPVGSWRGSLPRGMGLVEAGRLTQHANYESGFPPTQSSENEFEETDETWDPRSERGPGNPLFPTSFASLSLKPFERSPTASFGKSGTGPNANSQYPYTQVNNPPSGQAGNSGGIIMKDWAREMVERKEFRPMSGSALTVGSSEQSV
ncbi:hypothetical protein [Phaffia rhodozyma]|uniref:Uncharacterized protein n=1 Tax=Phaffia rhodozyma TaxID=264483 RepID=A0A0F7SMV7_PHARH|nr:hypothetical protein [Phaffia rhodozyma]